MHNRLIDSEVTLQLNNALQKSNIKRRSIGPDRKIVRINNHNLLLNTIVNEVEFSNRQVKEYLVNIIAKNILIGADSDEVSLTIIKVIINYSRDDIAISINKKFIIGAKI